MDTPSSCVIEKEVLMVKSKRRQFMREFKRDAVKLVMEKVFP
jgi:hypothetical protein